MIFVRGSLEDILLMRMLELVTIKKAQVISPLMVLNEGSGVSSGPLGHH